jgi:hypothetical protein
MASVQTQARQKKAAIKKTTTGKPPLRSMKKETDALAERRRLVASIKGKYAWIPYSVKNFTDDKRREIALENRA